MTRFIAVLLATLFLIGSTEAAPLPEPPEGGINWLYEGACTDNETGEKGYCHIGVDVSGAVYTTLWQDDKLMLIRRSTADGYETLWMSDEYASY